jgi:muramoyltetrapeptide carboxypeptidase LdcA involved in peptidoglycan recycling
MGLLNTSTSALVANPYELFAGFSDVTVITEQAETSTISIQSENRLVDLERPRIRRYTDEDQKSDTANASDIGFEFVPSLQDKVIKFGGG